MAITAKTSISLFRGGVGSIQNQQFLNTGTFEVLYEYITSQPFRPTLWGASFDTGLATDNNSPYPVKESLVWVDGGWLENLGRLFKAVYDCGSDIVEENPMFVYDCYGVTTRFRDTINNWPQAVGGDHEEITIHVPFQHPFFNKIVVEFSATSDSDDIEAPQIAYPLIPGVTSETVISGDKNHVVRVSFDLIQLRSQLGPDLFYNPIGIPVAFATKETEGIHPIARLAIGHALRLVMIGPDFAARVTTELTYSSPDGNYFDVPEREYGGHSLLDFWYYDEDGKTPFEDDEKNGVVHLQYTPEGQFYVSDYDSAQLKEYSQLKLDFTVASDIGIYAEMPILSLKPGPAILPNTFLPWTIQPVVPREGIAADLHWQAEGEGHIIAQFAPQQLGAAPSEFVLSLIAEGQDRFKEKQILQVIIEPLPLPRAPSFVATPADRSVSLTITAIAGATSYNVYHAPYGSLDPTLATKLAVPVVDFRASWITFTVPQLFDGVPYSFQISAVNPSGEGALSQQQTVTPTGPSGGPYTRSLNATANAYVDQSTPDTVHIPDPWSYLQCYFKAAAEQRTFLNFNIGELPQDAIIKTADLLIDVYTFIGSLRTRVETVAASAISVTEQGLTWNNQPAVYGSDLGGTTVHDGLNRISLDPARLQAYVGSGLSNWKGLRITILPTINWWDIVGLSSYPRTSFDPSQRPQLIITYTRRRTVDALNPYLTRVL